MSAAIDLAFATCAQCGAPSHVRKDGSVAKHCSTQCYNASIRADARLAVYGPLHDPWAIPSPQYPARHLPGRLCEMRVAGEHPNQCSIASGMTMHGLVATLTRHPHIRGRHHHALWPDPRGDRWWVLMPEEAAKYVALRRFNHAVGRRTAEVSFGPAIALRTPPAVAAGRYRVTIETQTPVVIRRTNADGGSKTRTEPTSDCIANTLAGQTLKRLGLLELPLHVAVSLVHSYSRPWIGMLDRTRHLGGDGRVRAFHGVLTVDCSGIALWLLRVSELIGLAGRTGYGFGRIRLMEQS